MDTQTLQAPGETRENKYLLLLISLLVVLILVPIHHELRIQQVISSTSYLTMGLFVVVMIFGVRGASSGARQRHLGTALWIGALVAWLIWVALDPKSVAARVVYTVANGMILAGSVMLTLLILVDLFRGEVGVTRDRLRGAACAYLLMGLAWALAYSLIYVWSPSSFTTGGGIQELYDKSVLNRGDAERIEFGHIMYYSFVTLTTLGYGDITPVRPLACTLAWLQAFAGQFYLTVLVAFLVGKRLATWMAESKS